MTWRVKVAMKNGGTHVVRNAALWSTVQPSHVSGLCLVVQQDDGAELSFVVDAIESLAIASEQALDEVELPDLRGTGGPDLQ